MSYILTTGKMLSCKKTFGTIEMLTVAVVKLWFMVVKLWFRYFLLDGHKISDNKIGSDCVSWASDPAMHTSDVLHRCYSRPPTETKSTFQNFDNHGVINGIEINANIQNMFSQTHICNHHCQRGSSHYLVSLVTATTLVITIPFPIMNTVYHSMCTRVWLQPYSICVCAVVDHMCVRVCAYIKYGVFEYTVRKSNWTPVTF